jgi:polyphosphate kinase
MSLLLLNREIGILEFNSRVLSQAEDPKIPLLERIRFLSIVSSNLDEFFEIRMAGIKEQLLDNPLKVGSDGRTITANYDLVSQRAHALVDRQYELYQQVLLPHLKRAGITFLLPEHWSSPQRSWAEDFFKEELLPLLTPIALDPVHPFPRVINKSLNFVVQLHGNDAFGRKANLAVVQAPRALPRYSYFYPHSFRPSCINCFREWKCLVVISSGLLATPICLYQMMRLLTFVRLYRVSYHPVIWGMLFVWKPISISRMIYYNDCAKKIILICLTATESTDR